MVQTAAEERARVVQTVAEDRARVAQRGGSQLGQTGRVTRPLVHRFATMPVTSSCSSRYSLCHNTRFPHAAAHTPLRHRFATVPDTTRYPGRALPCPVYYLLPCPGVLLPCTRHPPSPRVHHSVLPSSRHGHTSDQQLAGQTAALTRTL